MCADFDIRHALKMSQKKQSNSPLTKCEECRKKFSKVSNLRAHVKRKHPDKLDVLCPKKTYQPVVTCDECHQTFVKKSNLVTHMRRKHPDALTDPPKAPVQLKCTLCQFTDSRRDILMDHFKQIHDIEIEVETWEFDSFDDFNVWKNNIEEETLSSYVNVHGSYKTINYIRIRYSCHRSGQVRLRGNGLRRLKTQGSNKIDGYCPAAMDVMVKEEKCLVKFFKTHVGHDQELSRLFLKDPQRRELAAKIAAKIPFPTILEEIKESVANTQPDRLQLVKRKDLYNIERCFDLNRSIPEKKETVIAAFLEHINSVTCAEELDVIKKIMEPIGPSLDAFRQQLSSEPEPNSTVTLPKRRFSPTKERPDFKKRLSEQSATEQSIVYQIVREECDDDNNDNSNMIVELSQAGRQFSSEPESKKNQNATKKQVNSKTVLKKRLSEQSTAEESIVYQLVREECEDDNNDNSNVIVQLSQAGYQLMLEECGDDNDNSNVIVELSHLGRQCASELGSKQDQNAAILFPKNRFSPNKKRRNFRKRVSGQSAAEETGIVFQVVREDCDDDNNMLVELSPTS